MHVGLRQTRRGLSAGLRLVHVAAEDIDAQPLGGALRAAHCLPQLHAQMCATSARTCMERVVASRGMYSRCMYGEDMPGSITKDKCNASARLAKQAAHKAC